GESHVLGPEREEHVAVRFPVDGELSEWRLRLTTRGLRKQQVRTAEKLRDEKRARLIVALLGRAHLFDPPAAHNGHAIREREGFLLIVGHEKGRHPGRFQHAPDLLPRRLTQEGIQIRERLIEEHEARLRRERSRNRHPLLLSTRKLARITILISGQPDELDHLPGSLATLRSRPALEPEQHIAEHRKVGEERIILENEADAAALRRHVLAPG